MAYDEELAERLREALDDEACLEALLTEKKMFGVMRGRPMDGWLRVASDHLRTTRQLAKWVALGSGYARSLPPK